MEMSRNVSKKALIIVKPSEQTFAHTTDRETSRTHDNTEIFAGTRERDIGGATDKQIDPFSGHSTQAPKAANFGQTAKKEKDRYTSLAVREDIDSESLTHIWEIFDKFFKHGYNRTKQDSDHSTKRGNSTNTDTAMHRSAFSRKSSRNYEGFDV